MTRRVAPAIFRFRLLLGAEAGFGPGKADLLEAIHGCGSIAAAGRSLGMSYKRAWQLAEALNRCFRGPLLEASKGGRGGGGAQLTPLGLEIIARFRAIEAKSATVLAKELRAFARLVRASGEAD
jgi:molybdate transport system regulatory protein